MSEVILEPLYDRVMLQAVQAADQTKSGLFLPQTARAEVLEFEVVGVGQGRMLPNGGVELGTLQAGDRVLILAVAGYEVTLNEVTYRFVREGEVLARFRTVESEVAF